VKLRAPFLFLFLLLTATPAFAADQDLSALLGRSGFDTGTISEIRELFSEASSAGVPEELLLPRLQEGIAKGVPPGRIIAALEEDLATLMAARAAVESVDGGRRIIANTARWARAANFLAAGRTEGELRSIAAASSSRPESFRHATVLYVSLLDWGLDTGDVVEIVRAAVDSRLEPEEFSGIPELFALARRQRVRPERMVGRLVAALPRADSLRELRSMIIE
jgi:hypothetical protein